MRAETTTKKTLIVKLGALGDVVRTTVLLRAFDGEIYWLSQRNAADLLSSDKISRTFFIDDGGDLAFLKSTNFDLIINLDEDLEALRLIRNLKTKSFVGVFLNGRNRIDYTQDSGYWYDMSLVSKLGKEKADELKKKNRLSVPEILLGMLGKKFSGEEYDIGAKAKKSKGVIGLIDVSSGLWPNKDWHGYAALCPLLEQEGYRTKFLGMRKTVKEHIDDINNCELIVCGDTLGMHIALALKKKVVALFNCTSPYEIHDYGRLKKVTSPLYEEAFYKKERVVEVIHSIPVQDVYRAVMDMLAGDPDRCAKPGRTFA